MQCSYRLGLIRLTLSVPVRINSSVILECVAAIEVFYIHPITCTSVFISNTSHVCICSSRPCLPQMQTCSLKSPNGASLCFYSSSRSPLKSNTRLLSCYLVISLYSPAQCHVTPRGAQQIPRALLLIRNTQPPMTEGVKRRGKKGPFYV